MSDFAAVFLKDLREYVQLGTKNKMQFVGVVVSLLFINVFIPILTRDFWVSATFIVGAAGFTVIVMTMMTAADAYAGERERHTLETLLASRVSDRSIYFGKLSALLVAGLGVGAGQLVFGLASLAVLFGPRVELVLMVVVGLASLAGALVPALLFGAAGLIVSSRAASVKSAAQAMSLVMMGIFLLPSLGFSLVAANLESEPRLPGPMALLLILAGAVAGFLILTAFTVWVGTVLTRRHRLKLAA